MYKTFILILDGFQPVMFITLKVFDSRICWLCFL